MQDHDAFDKRGSPATASVDKDLLAAIAVTRFGLGGRPGEIDSARADPRGFLKAQIRPAGALQPPGDLPASPQLLAEAAEARRMAKADAAAFGQAQQVRRDAVVAEIAARAALGVATPDGFAERWVQFWSNHFTVSTTKGQTAPIAGAFEREAIRPHAFGRFADMLDASTHHPAMLFYLDQPRSAGPNSPGGQRRKLGLNENLAREVMELHTVGLDAGYTQADVTEFARALTGWSVETDAPTGGAQAGTFVFRPNLHEPGARTILGRTYRQDAEDQGRAVLTDLARHPATARHVADALARHFVVDAPPPSLVTRLSLAFTRSGGDLAHVATALVEAPEAWTPTAVKLRTPNEFVIAAYRASGIAPSNPQRFAGALTQLGQRPFAAPSPKGWSDQSADWAAPDAIVKRMAWAELFAQAAGDRIDPLTLAQNALGARLGEPARKAIARAESRPEAVAILLMSPEFQRR